MTKKTNKEPKYKSFIAVFSGSKSDLSLLDFSKLGLHFLNLKSDEFKELLDEVESKQLRITTVIEEYLKENGDSDHMYALVPQDFKASIPEKDFWMVRNILLVIFPSSITLHYLIDIDRIEDDKIYTSAQSHFKFNPAWKEDFYENFLLFDKSEIESTNSFIQLYIERINNLSYLEPTLHSYLSSFFQPFPEMEFLNLCIALETIVDGRSELTYRIRRNAAILVGISITTSRIIYSNVNKIYSLRSQIVHSGTFDYEKVYQYAPYLKSLVSRIIIEILTHNYSQLQELNLKLTEIGFGQYKELSEDYSRFEINSTAWVDSFNTKLK